MHFKKVAIVDYGLDYFLHVILLVGVFGKDINQLGINSVWVVICLNYRRLFGVVMRMKDNSFFILSKQSYSLLAIRWATPDFVACVRAPPNSSNDTSWLITSLTTSGP